MSVLLIRHGETDFNATRVVQHPHTPLGENGLNQAQQLGASLRQRRIGLVLSSDYARARMTAECVAASCGVDIVESEHLRERNFGDIRGTPYGELGDLDIFAVDYHPPAGENGAMFDRRVDLAWEQIVTHASRTADDLAVITHGLVLRSLLTRKLDLGTVTIPADLVVANTSVTEIEHAPPWRVLALANTDHLADGPNSGAAV